MTTFEDYLNASNNNSNNLNESYIDDSFLKDYESSGIDKHNALRKICNDTVTKLNRKFASTGFIFKSEFGEGVRGGKLLEANNVLDTKDGEINFSVFYHSYRDSTDLLLKMSNEVALLDGKDTKKLSQCMKDADKIIKVVNTTMKELNEAKHKL